MKIIAIAYRVAHQQVRRVGLTSRNDWKSGGASTKRRRRSIVVVGLNFTRDCRDEESGEQIGDKTTEGQDVASALKISHTSRQVAREEKAVNTFLANTIVRVKLEQLAERYGSRPAVGRMGQRPE